MDICLTSAKENTRKPWAQSGPIRGRELRPGFNLYYTDCLPKEPMVLSSDSWPAGFGWIFFLSGKILYHHHSLGREMEMTAGLNRLAFQPGTSGWARLIPGAPVRVVTLTMTRECLIKSLGSDVGLLPVKLRRAAQCDGTGGCFEINANTPGIQSTLSGLASALTRPGSPAMLVEGLALELIGQQFELFAFRPPGPELRPGELEKLTAARQILENDWEAPPSLVSLARQTGLTPNRLSAGFKQLYGTTPFAFLRTLRLNRARRLLEEQKMNVTEAAMAVGYDSLSHFSKAFFKAFGILPGQCLRRQ